MESGLTQEAWLTIAATVAGIVLVAGVSLRRARLLKEFARDYAQGRIDPLDGRPRTRWILRRTGLVQPTFAIEDVDAARPIGELRLTKTFLANTAELDLAGARYRIEAPPRQSAVPGSDCAMWRDGDPVPVAAARAKAFGPAVRITSPLGNLEVRTVMAGRRPENEIWRDGSLVGFTFREPSGESRLDFDLPESAAPLMAFAFYQTFARGSAG